MENIKDLRDELLSVFTALKNGTIKNKDAKELVNAGGKIILTSKVQMDYQKLQGYKGKIKFLEVEGENHLDEA